MGARLSSLGLCALSLVALLPSPPATAAPAPAFVPLQVALDVLPEAMQLAIEESQLQLISDQAQALIDDTYAYVQGFDALPAGNAALADPETRAAYQWVGEVVETFLAIPAQFDSVASAGATCRSYGENATAEQVEAAHESGQTGSGTMFALRAELDRLAAAVPSGIDRASFDEALALLDGWRDTEEVEVIDCLAELGPAAELETLQAVLLPRKTFPTGTVRIVGRVQGFSSVSASAPSLGVSSSAPAENETFRMSFAVPRTAALTTHTVDVRAGHLEVELRLVVTRTDIRLLVQAPDRVATGTQFTVQVTASSAAGAAEVDRESLTLAWRGTTIPIRLSGGAASVTLEAGTPASEALVLTYPQTGVLNGKSTQLRIQVYDPNAVVHVEVQEGGTAWIWWLVVGLLGLAAAICLFLMPVVIHRVGGWRGRALQGKPGPARWPGASTFVAAVGALFELLRRRDLVPPGVTFREWLRAKGGPTYLADRFDAARYGDAPEDVDTQRSSLKWVQGAWDVWRLR